jgi:Fe-S cluster biogenesis protein NfuA
MTREKQVIVEDIIRVLNDFVAPAVSQHGGQVNFLEFNEETGDLLLEMSGACSGCAGSTATLKYGIENMLTHLVPEVKTINAIDDLNSGVDPFFTDPFMFHDYGMEDLEDTDIDPNN